MAPPSSGNVPGPRGGPIPKTVGPKALPADLRKWLADHDAKFIEGIASTPLDPEGKPYVLVAVPLRSLEFQNHHYNPRVPNPGRVKEIEASVIQLTLLTPLTCAYLTPDQRADEETSVQDEAVVLIDGRHRYTALNELRQLPGSGADWFSSAVQDMKIYYDLTKSEILMLSTYLNRTRRNLKKGEYFAFVVEIYEEKKKELESKRGTAVTEQDVFDEISIRAVPNKDFDLSVGRIVGMTAFDEEEDGSWYPMVGLRQKQPYVDPARGYCPMTAGNLATLLKYFCKTDAYQDTGKTRAVEIDNVLQLGEEFRRKILKDPIRNYELATATSVSCKYWCLEALGTVFEESVLFQRAREDRRAPFAFEKQDWPTIRRTLDAYYQVMGDQAEQVNVAKAKAEEDPDFLLRVWSYQTQSGQIVPPLRRFLSSHVPAMAKAKVAAT